MPRPGPRPYECIRRAWHSDTHQPLRGALIQEIFRVVNEIHNPMTRRKKEWQEKLPIVVLRAEEILYSKGNSESEYADVKSLRSRLDDAVNTMIRREETEEDGVYIAPCIEAALSLGCTPKKVPRGQRAAGASHFLPISIKRSGSIIENNGSYKSVPDIIETSRDVQCFRSAHEKQCQSSIMSINGNWASTPEQGSNAFTTSSSAHSSINGSPRFSASRRNLGLINHPVQCLSFKPPSSASLEVSHSACSTLSEPCGSVQFLQPTPRCQIPYASSSTSHLLFNAHSDPQHVSNKCKGNIKGVPSASDTQTSSISKLSKEASYIDQITPGFSSNEIAGCANSRVGISTQNSQPYHQETRFNPNLATFSTWSNSSPLAHMGSRVGLSHPSSNSCETASMVMPSNHTSPVQVPHPSLNSSETTSMKMPSNHTSPLQVLCPSSNSNETTLMLIPSNPASVIDVICPLQQTNVYDLQLRLGPPRSSNSQKISENVSSRSIPRNHPMMVVPDGKLRHVKISSVADIDMPPSKRIKSDMQRFNTLSSRQYNGSHPPQQFSQPRG